MARGAKYDWPDDETLQSLLDEYGTAETAGLIGCPPSSLSNRIRRHGLRGPNQRRKEDPAKANGKPEAAKANGKPDAATPNQKPDAPEPSDGSADYRIRRKPETFAPVKTGRESDSFAPPPASGASRPKRPGPALVRRVAGPSRRVPPAIWRSIAVLALAAVAGIAAFISVSNDPNTYERETSFAVRPSSDVPPDAVNDVLGTLAQPDSAITETIVNMLGSPRLRNFAAQSAGVSESSVGGNGAEYVWSATRRTGSTIIDIRLTGPDDDKLLAMQTAAGPEAARLVEESYSPYRLEPLSAPSPPVQVGPKTARTVGLALLLGALLGITLVLVERRLRSSLPQRGGPARAPAERGEPWEH
jgi:capsular polysaccharide biosynthesis protein